MEEHVEVRETAPHQWRAASDAMRHALLQGPNDDEQWAKAEASWTDAMSFSAWDGDRCVGHAGAFRVDSVVPGGARLATAAVTRVGVLPTYTRQGLLTRMMTALLRAALAEGRPIANLRASEATIYGRFGFGIAGYATTAKIDTRRARPLANVAPGSVRILTREELLEVVPPLYDRIVNRPGAISRAPMFWTRYLEDALEGTKGSFVVVHRSPDGVDDGYCHYSLKWTEQTFTASSGTGEVHDLFGESAAVEMALWQHLTGIDLVRSYTADERPEDDVARWAFADPRAYLVTERWDEQWVRLLDVPTALAARTYGPGGPVTIAVTDPLFEDNDGTYEISSAGAQRVGRPSAGADLSTDIATLSAAYYGSTSWHELAAAGRVHATGDVVRAGDALFAHRPLAWAGSFF